MMYNTFIVLTVITCSANGAFIVAVNNEAYVEEAPLSSEGSCDYRSCDQLCRRLGFPGGACVGDRCQCDNFLKSPAYVEEASLSSEGSCDYRSCDQLCRRLGFPGGACVGDRCKCDNFLQSPAYVEEAPLSSEGSCDYRSCDQLCRRLGFPGGACVGDRCKCDNFLQSPETTDMSLNDAVSLTDQDLNILDEGKPEENEKTLDSEVNIDKGVLPNEEKLGMDATQRATVLRGSCDCVDRNCNFYCFRLHYSGGVCLTGQCRCYR